MCTVINSSTHYNIILYLFNMYDYKYIVYGVSIDINNYNSKINTLG